MGTLFNFLVVMVEALFLTIPTTYIKKFDFKKSVILYIWSLGLLVLTDLTMNGIIYKYLSYVFIFYLYIMILDKKSQFYDIFIMPFLMAIKLITEFCIVMLLYERLDMSVITIIFEAVNILTVIGLRGPICKFCNFIKDKWKSEHTFYTRYTILVSVIFLFIFIIYNLVKIKEMM